MKKLKRWLGRCIPRLSRPQRILRNAACILLMAVTAWFIMGAPALTARWAFRRAERLNLMEGAEILDVVRLEERFRLVVAESEENYILFYDCPHYEKTGLTFDAKSSPITMMMPMGPGWMIWDYPIVLLTELPAVRGEIEFTLIPEVSDVYVEEEIHYLVEGERLDSGNFLFVVDSGLAEYEKYGPNKGHLAESDVMTTMGYLAMARYNVQQTCRVDIAVRLWDEDGSLIYDEILRNGVEVIDNEN